MMNYIIPDSIASKAKVRDLQTKGEIPARVAWEINEAGWANKYSGVRITRMLLNDLRLRKDFPVRILTDAHKSSTTKAVTTMLKKNGMPECNLSFLDPQNIRNLWI